MPVRVVVAAEAALPGLDPAVAERAARAALEVMGVGDAELSITLLDDAAMAALNRDWKGADRPTDVLAFSLHEPGDAPLGDIYLGVERAAEQAIEAAEAPARELARLAIHGTLHVLGWDHPEEERETSELWMHQERILDGLDPR